ncbi:hypothetical protein BK011_08780 [Tenericutes bacterium MZ-XQ]|nr:hypothetical protein BK011_08780 [Tenericutes bacterium MZ-XQ]
MKKTLVLLLVVLSVLTLAGCQDEEQEVTDTVKPVISGMEDMVLTLGDEAPNWLDGVTATDDVDGNVTVTVDASAVILTEAGIYDVIYSAEDEAGNLESVTIKVTVNNPEVDAFYVSLLDLEGSTLMNETIEFDASNETPIIELIDAVVELDYTVFDFGTMIHGVGGHYPKEYGASYNYYYQIIVDGTPIMTGLDQVVYEDDMTIEFVETSTLSAFDQQVDDFIYDFIETHMDTYITDSAVDYNVLSAVYQLNMRNYIDLDVTSRYTYENISITQESFADLSVGNLMKLAIYMTIEHLDTTPLKDHLLTLDVTNAYELTSYLQALSMLGETDQDAALSLINHTLEDPDFIGMSYTALYGYEALDGFDTYMTSSYTYIETTLSEDGIVSWGNANASSTAQLILGLVAQGINPQDEAYQTNTIGLVEALMAYELNGGFKWMITDENPDLMFSTPQAFSALVAYKLSRDIWGFPATHLFDLD